MAEPPNVMKKDHYIEIHDKKWNDPYYWLRDKENEEVISYLEAENEYTEKIMKHTELFQKKLFSEMKSRIKETDQSVPTKRDNYYYYHRTVEGKDYKIYCRKHESMENEEEILLDVNELAKGKEYTSIGNIEISPNHDILAYSVDFTGYETYEIYFKNMITDQIFNYTLEETGGRIIWVDNNSIYFDLQDDIHRPYQLMYHRLEQQNKNQLVYEEPNKEFFLWSFKSRDKKFVFIISHGRESDVIRYIDIESDPQNFIQFNEQIDNVEYRIDHHGEYFYFVTSKDAINFKFCRTRGGSNDEKYWEELIAHDPKVKLNAVMMFKDHGVIHFREKGYANFKIFSLPKLDYHSIELPELIHSINFGENPNFYTSKFRFKYSSMVTPPRDYDYEMETRKLSLLKEKEIYHYDPSNFTTKREYAEARDGTEIPVSLAYKKDIQLPAPMVLYGYGSYGASIDPNFDDKRVSLLDRGIIYAIAHIRGGGELGKPWYHDGKLKNKKNTFRDFVDSASYLIESGYTSTNQLAIYGGSAGGLLIGAVVNMRPDLFKSAVARVPFVDVISTMMDDSIPLTTFEYLEWGNPVDNKEDFEYMQSYSPYDQTGRETTKYPDMLVTSGLNDPRVHYWEPTKWVAKLRDVKTDDNRLLLKTNMGAGHSGASGRYKRMNEFAFIFTYIMDTLGVELD